MYVVLACYQLATLCDDQSVLLLSCSPIIKVITNVKQVGNCTVLHIYRTAVLLLRIQTLPVLIC